MENRENPLLNSLVISHVIQFLSYRDKKALRHVCNTWNDEIKKALRKESRVRIEATGAHHLDNLINSPCDPKFATDFDFGPKLNFKDVGNLSTSLGQFFSKFGPTTKTLSINNCICTTSDLRRILYENCPNLESLRFVAVISGRLHTEEEEGSPAQRTNKNLLPNLKCLQVNIRSSDLVRNTDLMVDFLSSAPNLESISWLKLAHDEVNYDRNFQLDLEKAWSAQRPANGLTIRDTIYDVAIHYTPLNLSKLSRIESNMRLSDASLLVLRDRHFPLKSLDIRLTIDVYDGTLRTLLESLSGTLKALKIEFYPAVPYLSGVVCENLKITHGNFNFPKLDKLEHLFLKMYCNNFDFLADFKSLKTLSFCEWDIRECLKKIYVCVLEAEMAEAEEVALNTNLQMFQVFSEESHQPSFHCDKDGIFSTEDVSHLVKSFPNISEIRGKGCGKNKEKWVDLFPQLKVVDDDVTEKGIGGLKGFKSEINECCYCCAHKRQNLSWSFR